MSDKKISSREKEKIFNSKLVEEYLKYGSVDVVFRKNNYHLPISYAQYQRVLNNWGIIKAAGPNNKLTEILGFLTHLAKDNIAFEDLYKKMPPSFRTSAVTLYRVLSYVKGGITRRVGSALVITPYNSPCKVLIAKDVSTPRVELGKQYGSMSLPMGFASKADSRRNSIIRILQQEVFVKQTIDNSFPYEIIPDSPNPFLYLDIADVRVSVYHIQLPKELSSKKYFSSFKLKDYSFKDVEDLLNNHPAFSLYRAGIVDALVGYREYLSLLGKNLSFNPLQHRSGLNLDLQLVGR